MKKSKIQKYISNFTYVGPRAKGRKLFLNKSVKLTGKAVNADEFTFSVLGSAGKKYKVRIENSLSENSDISTHCTCPYDHGGVCKHVVAALLFIEDNFRAPSSVETKKSSPTKRNTNNWLDLGDCKKLTIEDINRRQPYNSQNYYEHKIWESKGVGKQLEVKVGSRFSYDNELVKLKLDKDTLHINCTCGRNIKFLCLHEYTVLHEIGTFEWLHMAFNSSPDEEYQKLANKYGLTQAMAKECFDYSFSLEGHAFTSNEKGRGLIPVEENALGSYAQLLQESVGKIDIETVLGKKEKNEKKEQYAFGFFYNEDYLGTEISPLSGRISAKGELISIKHLKHFYGLSEVPEEIITELKAVESFSKTYLDGQFSKLEEYHDKLGALLEILHDKEYLFRSQSPGNNFLRADLVPVTLSEKRVKTVLYVEESELMISLSIKLEINGKRYKLGYTKLNHNYTGVVFISEVGYQFESAKHLSLYLEFKDKVKVQMSKTFAQKFLEEIVAPLAENYTVDFSGLKSFKLQHVKSEVQAKKIYLSEVSNFVVFKPFVTYQNATERNVLSDNFLFKVEDKNIRVEKPDEAVEKNFADFLKNLHPRFAQQRNSDYFYLSYEELVAKGWFFDAFEQFKQEGIEVFGLNTLKKFKYSPHKAVVNSNMASGQDWFELDFEIAFGDNVVSLRDVQKALKKGENFVKLGDGTLGLLPQEWIAKMERYFRLGQLSKDKLQISKLKFSLVDELFDQIDDQQIIEELAEKRSKLKAFEDIEQVEVPAGIKAQLRDYQKEGLNWLSFLNDFGWGGILADDMGLGKTVQILSFLQKRAAESKKASLVIIPTTLLFNWQHEIEKFTTDLKILLHYGPDREKDHKHFKKYDVVISTYTTMINDIDFLRKYTFDYIILDESQAIKNSASQRYKAACTLKAANRIALTGTPIENNTFDLYAQMNFLNPGFLGNATQFKEQYSTPIDRDGDAQRAAELQQVIKPFILRRTKEQVAKELPPKTEDVLICEMSAAQRKVYDAFRNKYRDYLLGKIEEDGLGKSKMYVLEGLTKLRQICDSPELLSDEEDYGTDSVKVEELLRHIKDKTGRHKVLVFSQFVKMLSVIRGKLDADGISYEYLDGQSSQQQREASVNHFQNDDQCRVFLISLKAGGTGLNLTAADYVYLVDPWWNPAVENQAIDRSYRIGQDKKVFAYRMICKDTVEEKILQYQEKKRAVAEDIITTDESFMKNLSKNDIQDLFA